MGIAAPYCSLSQTLRRPSLDLEGDEHGDDESPLSTVMDCSSDDHSLSSDQGFPKFLKNNTSREAKRQTPQAQGDLWKFKPRTFNSSPDLPHLNQASLAHQEYLSNSMTYSIKGLGVAQSCPQAMFRPIIRVYPPPYGRPDTSGSRLDYLRASPFIEHIDITTVWKGLLLSDAEQLLYLDRAFKDCLEDLLADALVDVHKEFQQQCASYHDQDIRALVRSSLNRQLSFTLQHLVLSMSQRLKLCGKLPDRGSTRDFELLLPLFLVSCDCLMGFEGDSVGDTAVDICVHYCDPSHDIFPRGPINEAAWIPDMLSFNEINQLQREGQELTIIPRYCGNAAFTADITRTDIQYFVESPEPWLVWDESISGFRGNVPLFSEMGCVRRPGKAYRSPRDGPYATINILRVEIRALLTAGYGSPIRLQKTVRVRLTFKVVPWFAHDSACSPTDELVRPFRFHYPECDSPAPSSIGNRLGEKIEHESSVNDIASDDVTHCVSSQNSRASSNEHLAAATSLQSCEISLRERRAASGFKTPSPAKLHRENDNKEHAIGTFNPQIEDLSVSTIQEEMDESRSCSTTPNASSSCSVWTLHSRDNLSPMGVDSHVTSGDVDKAPRFKHSEEVSLGIIPFEENGLALAARNESLDPIYAVPVAHEKGDVEANSTQQRTHPDGQYFDPRIVAVDENLISGIPPPKRIRRDELCNLKLRTCSNTLSGITHKSKTSGDRLFSPISGSRQSSSTMEIIVENPDVDPQIRREQAILWNVLSIKEAQSNDKGATMSVDELKDMCAAMKLSVTEAEDREMTKMGFSEAFDDIFISSSDGSENDMDMDESNDKPCPQEPLDDMTSGWDESIEKRRLEHWALDEALMHR